MHDIWVKMAAASSIFVVVSAGQLSAGGLSDQIVEEQQVLAPVASVAENGLSGWILPAAGLFLLGVVVASGDDGNGSSNGGGVPPIIDPK